MQHKTKILCSIGPATRSPQTLRKLLQSGMDVARLNFSHGNTVQHQENIERIRTAAEEEGCPVAIQVDLQGPKFRMGNLPEAGITAAQGDDILLTAAANRCPEALPVQNEQLPNLVEAGNRILIDDGLIELRVIDKTENIVQCEVITGGTIKSNKGINLPGVSADLPSLTEKDLRDLQHALEWGADWIALSFVRSAKDVEVLKTHIREHTDRPVPVMAKIEKSEALDQIDEIIAAADAIMVARGDLGIEIPTEQVPMAQKNIIRRCNEAGIPVVTATQMLDSMIHNKRPTRAEASDVANAILDGTDAVMLSGETTIGEYPVEALQTMGRIIHEVEKKQTEAQVHTFKPREERINLTIARAIASAVREVSYNLDIQAIIAITASGYTACIVSRYRPRATIIAITHDVQVQRRLMLYWGVIPLLAPRSDNTDEMIRTALHTAKQETLIQTKDLVAITSGTAGSAPGTTNLMRIYQID